MSKVFLALQDVDEARPIVDAVVQDNPKAEIEYQPAMIRITAPRSLIVKKETVEEITGCEWDPQELQLVLISFGGNVDEDDDYFRIYWN